MGPGRLEAFSDGVIAIIITIMVLELKVPHGDGIEALVPLVPVFASYVLSFVFVAIYWGNHHHLLRAAHHVTPGVIWANAHLMFWLSLVPFATGWMGENHLAPVPTAAYGAVLLLSGLAFFLLQRSIAATLHDASRAREVLRDGERKGILSLVAYSASVGLAFVNPVISGALFVLVAIMWVIPDRALEKVHE